MQLKPVDFSLKPHEQLGLALNEVEEANEESFDQKLEKLDTKVHRRFHTQIGFVMERVERLEAIVSFRRLEIKFQMFRSKNCNAF